MLTPEARKRLSKACGMLLQAAVIGESIDPSPDYKPYFRTRADSVNYFYAVELLKRNVLANVKPGAWSVVKRAPLIIINGDGSRCGKTHLAHSLIKAVWGEDHVVQTTAFPRNIEPSLSAAVVEERPYLFFDGLKRNDLLRPSVHHPVCRFQSDPRWNVRELGASCGESRATSYVINTALIVAGDLLAGSGDLARRCLVINLQTPKGGKE